MIVPIISLTVIGVVSFFVYRYYWWPKIVETWKEAIKALDQIDYD